MYRRVRQSKESNYQMPIIKMMMSKAIRYIIQPQANLSKYATTPISTLPMKATRIPTLWSQESKPTERCPIWMRIYLLLQWMIRINIWPLLVDYPSEKNATGSTKITNSAKRKLMKAQRASTIVGILEWRCWPLMRWILQRDHNMKMGSRMI